MDENSAPIATTTTTAITEEEKGEEEEEDSDTKLLFNKIRYIIIKSNNDNIGELLKENGAMEDHYMSSLITHVICDDHLTDNIEYTEAKEVFDLKIVKSEWVEKCLQLKALLPLEPFSPDTSSPYFLFRSVRACNINVNPLITKPLMALLTYYGGKALPFEQNQTDSQLTHGFVSSFDRHLFQTIGLQCDSDDDTETSERTKLKLVTPDWLSDSLVANCLLDEAKYNPKYLVTNPDNEPVIQSIKQNEKEEKEEEEKKRLKEEEEETKIENQIEVTTTTPTTTESESYKNKTKKNSIKPQMAFDELYAPNFNEEELPPQLAASTTLPTTTATTTPPSKSATKQRKSRKLSQTGISPLLTGGDGQSPSTFASDMDDIFQSVLNRNTVEETTTNNNNNNNNSNNQNKLKTLNKTSDQPVAVYLTQENSHLINFNCCLIGCVFYIKSSDSYYPPQYLHDWRRVIERFQGRVVDNYYLDEGKMIPNSEITHVLCPNRFGDIYNQVLIKKM
jgi:hypothetical protein